MQPILNINDVAERLGVTSATILNWIRDAGFPAGRRLGGPRSRRIWLDADLDAWINRPAATTKPAKAARRAAPVVQPDNGESLT